MPFTKRSLYGNIQCDYIVMWGMHRRNFQILNCLTSIAVIASAIYRQNWICSILFCLLVGCIVKFALILWKRNKNGAVMPVLHSPMPQRSSEDRYSDEALCSAVGLATV